MTIVTDTLFTRVHHLQLWSRCFSRLQVVLLTLFIHAWLTEACLQCDSPLVCSNVASSISGSAQMCWTSWAAVGSVEGEKDRPKRATLGRAGTGRKGGKRSHEASNNDYAVSPSQVFLQNRKVDDSKVLYQICLSCSLLASVKLTGHFLKRGIRVRALPVLIKDTLYYCHQQEQVQKRAELRSQHL